MDSNHRPAPLGFRDLNLYSPSMGVGKKILGGNELEPSDLSYPSGYMNVFFSNWLFIYKIGTNGIEPPTKMILTTFISPNIQK